MSNRLTVILAIILGLVFIALSVIYFTHTAANLPHYLPGYEAGLDKKHTKHGIGTLALGIASFIFAWFQSGPKKVSDTSESAN